MIYEGTTKVKETKANLLITEYEIFKMKTDESISNMFARLMQLINHLKAMGKTYTDIELVRKILQSLTSVWHTKVTVIEDSKNMSTMTLDELIGSLMTYELNLKRNEEDRKFNSIRFKTEEKSKAKKMSSEKGSAKSESDEDLALITRKLQSILKRRKNYNVSSSSRPRQSSR